MTSSDSDRRQIDIDMTDIKLSIREIETHMERSIPALEQVWKNKEAISRTKLIQSIIVWIGAITGTGFIYALIKEIIIKNHPSPPHIPH